MVSVVKIVVEASDHRHFLMSQAGPDYYCGSWGKCPYVRIIGSPKNLLCKYLKKTYWTQINKIFKIFDFFVLYVLEKAFYE